MQFASRTLPIMRDIAARIDRGEFKTTTQLQEAMAAVEREARSAVTRPTNRPN